MYSMVNARWTGMRVKVWSLMLMAIHHHRSGFVYGRSNGCLEFILFRISMYWRSRTLSSHSFVIPMCVCVLFFNQSFSIACICPYCLHISFYFSFKLTPFFNNNNTIIRRRWHRRCRRRHHRLRSHFSGAMLLIRASVHMYEIDEQNGSHHHSHCVIGILQIFSFNNQLHKLRFATGFTVQNQIQQNQNQHTFTMKIEINKILLRRWFWSMHCILFTSIRHTAFSYIYFSLQLDFFVWITIRYKPTVFSSKSTSNVRM